MASFDEKVEALKRLRERRQARAAAPEEGDLAASNTGEAACGPSSDGPAAPAAPPRPDPAGPGGDGEADALFCAGHCHERGLHGCEVNEAQAAECYLIAAEKGNADAQWRLGELCEFGRGVERDEKRAAHWYRCAAEAGQAQAQSGLALLLEDGRGVACDEAEALRWHLAAAEQGQALSQYCAACCLAEGRGGERDSTRARHWLEQSAAAGFVPAVRALASVSGGAAQAEATAEPCGGEDEGPEEGELMGLAARVAEQLKGLPEEEAEAMLDALLGEGLLEAGDLDMAGLSPCNVGSVAA